jgi:tripartite ATP-independent transporter DctP family solute receptor
MKRLAIILISLLLLFSCRFGKQKVFKLAESQPGDYPSAKADIEFARLVLEKTKSKIKIEIYHSGQLGDEKSVLEKMQYGAIEFSRVSLLPVASYYSKLNVLYMPYLYKNDEKMRKVLDGPVGDQLLKEIERAKFVGLCFYDGGTSNFYNKKREIKSAKDLRGLKFSSQNSPMTTSMIWSLNATPKQIPSNEISASIVAGTIDGAENTLPEYEAQDIYQNAKFYTMDAHYKIPEILLASQVIWNKLTKKEQDAIYLSAKESSLLQKKLLADKIKSIEDKVKSAGCIITNIDDNSDFQKAVQPLYDNLPADQRDLVKIIRSVQ